jgi:hypothetical protein
MTLWHRVRLWMRSVARRSRRIQRVPAWRGKRRCGGHASSLAASSTQKKNAAKPAARSCVSILFCLRPQLKQERLGVTEIDRSQATEYYRASRGQNPHGATKSLFFHMSVAVGWDAFRLAECMMVRASARR